MRADGSATRPVRPRSRESVVELGVLAVGGAEGREVVEEAQAGRVEAQEPEDFAVADGEVERRAGVDGEAVGQLPRRGDAGHPRAEVELQVRRRDEAAEALRERPEVRRARGRFSISGALQLQAYIQLHLRRGNIGIPERKRV